MSEVKLTRYSHGSGCGCEIAQKVVDGVQTACMDAGISLAGSHNIIPPLWMESNLENG